MLPPSYMFSFYQVVLWTTHVLAEHGSALIFSILVMAATFFAAIYLPIPVMQQFCLQVTILLGSFSICPLASLNF